MALLEKQADGTLKEANKEAWVNDYAAKLEAKKAAHENDNLDSWRAQQRIQADKELKRLNAHLNKDKVDPRLEIMKLINQDLGVRDVHHDTMKNGMVIVIHGQDNDFTLTITKKKERVAQEELD